MAPEGYKTEIVPLTLLEALADAFAVVEKTDARIFFLHVGPKLYKALLAPDITATNLFAGRAACVGKLWGAELVKDPKVPAGKVMFRYKRRIAPGGKKGPHGEVPEEQWCDPKLFGRYRMTVRLKFEREVLRLDGMPNRPGDTSRAPQGSSSL
jgi:hypothetical protein